MHSHKLLVRDEKKVKYRTFRKILNVAICHLFVTILTMLKALEILKVTAKLYSKESGSS